MVEFESRLATAEHILARVLQNRSSDLKVRMVKFYLDYGQVEFLSDSDLREYSREDLNNEVNSIISLNIEVRKEVLPREKASLIVDLSRVNVELDNVRIVSVGDFDSRACGDLHVDNTSEIGRFEIFKIKRVGDGRYRYQFRVFDE